MLSTSCSRARPSYGRATSKPPRPDREALATLRGRAATLLTESGHGATESTLRKVTTTLSALAANGGFDPDPPGALGADREPRVRSVRVRPQARPKRARPSASRGEKA